MREAQLEETLLKRQDAAKLLGVSAGTLGVWGSKCRNRYNLPFVKVGRLVRYKLSDLNLFIKKQTKNGKSDK